MARSGQFSAPSFIFGAPLLSIHPIDNKFPDLKEKDDEGETQPVEEQQPPQEDK